MASNGSPLNRDLQRKLLLIMRDAYPDRLRQIPDVDGYSQHEITTNLCYLEEHQLCDAGLTRNMDGTFASNGARISANGLDFIEDDGGLSAILGVVTIKIHDETIRELIKSRIDSMDAPENEKSRLKLTLDKLSEEGLKAVTTDLVRQGLHHVPSLFELLRTASGF